ncbi:virulence factor family protein [Corallococcus sp. M34]|nr:virulence factor family protein [Citreicoccus inhibens]
MRSAGVDAERTRLASTNADAAKPPAERAGAGAGKRSEAGVSVDAGVALRADGGADAGKLAVGRKSNDGGVAPGVDGGGDAGAQGLDGGTPDGGARGLGETLQVGGRFGRVTVVRPADGAAPRTVALVLVDGPPEQGRGAELASTLAARGALVLGVDVNAYLRTVEKSKRCAYPAGDLEVLSQGYQQHAALPEYLHPIVVGEGPGAAVAYAALAQAPPGTFRGAVSIDFASDLETSAAFCSGSGLVHTRPGGGSREHFEPARGLLEPWVVLVSEKDPAHPVQALQDSLRGMKSAQVMTVPGSTSLRRAPVESWKAALGAAYDAVATPLESERLPPPATPLSGADAGLAPDASTVAASTPSPESVSDLPLIEVPAVKQGGDTLALLVTGDGGWANLDKEVARALSEQGIPVVGWNSLRYFWKRRTPGETATDVARASRYYLSAWGKQRVLLLGYSRGADVVPAIAAGFPPDLRARVRMLALIAPAREAEFEVHVTDIFGGKGNPSHAVLPDLQSLGSLPVLCLYSAEEADESVCPQLLGRTNVHIEALKGGHHFDGDYANLARIITEALAAWAR